MTFSVGSLVTARGREWVVPEVRAAENTDLDLVGVVPFVIRVAARFQRVRPRIS